MSRPRAAPPDPAAGQAPAGTGAGARPPTGGAPGFSAGPGPGAGPVADEAHWLAAEQQDATGAARRLAATMARELGLPAARVAELEIVATELATNLARHATEGAIVVRALRDGAAGGIELIAMDRGPGIADVVASAVDGHSTAGGLGVGLGAIFRQSTWWDGYSLPGRGTVLAAQVWPRRPAPAAWAQGLERPMSGAHTCGDGFAIRADEGRGLVMLCDGLGHGPLAAAATRAAVRAFLDAEPAPPVRMLDLLHRALAHTRGAAVLVAELDPAAGVVRCAGLGNVAGTVGLQRDRRALVSLPGIVGHQRPAMRQFEYPMPPGGVLIMHSDGVTPKWTLAELPGLLEHDPTVVAATIMRDAAVRRDDASVLVARYPGPDPAAGP